jgi:hypothetical protein
MRKIDPRQGANKKFLGQAAPLHSSVTARQAGGHSNIAGAGSGLAHAVQSGGSPLNDSKAAALLPHAYSGQPGKHFTGVQVPSTPGMRSRVHDLPHAAPGVNHGRAMAQKAERHAMAHATGSACLTEAYSFGSTQDRMARPRTGTKPKAAAPGWLKPSQRLK